MHQPGDVFADDVEFEVHDRTDFDAAKIRVLEGVGNDRHPETALFRVADREAHAVDRHRTFLDRAKSGALRLVLEGEVPASVGILLRRRRPPSASAKEDADGSWYFTFEYEPQGAGLCTVEKGSVTVNGVSLTVCDSKESSFRVAIIPYTFEHTNFCRIEVGSVVNLEFDIVGKYIARLMQNYMK